MPAVAGLLLAGLLAAGCAQQLPRTASVTGCLRVSVAALRQHAALTALPGPCKGLRHARLTSVADAAVAAVAGPAHGKRLMRARLRELSPLLPHLPPGTGAGPVPLTAPAGGGGGLPLGAAALAAWLITVGLGTGMMARWVTRGGLRHAAGRAGARPVMNFAHLGLALAGLASWIGYLTTGLGALAWTACLLLLPVTGLGMSLLLLRLPARSPAATAALAVPVPAGPLLVQVPASRPATSGPAVLIVAAHIVFAVATLLLTLLATVGSG